MEKFNLQYSKKNIPMPSRHEYKRLLMANTISFLKRMRWKALAFDGKIKPSTKNTYGFATSYFPDACSDLAQFEKDLMNLVRSIEFRPVHNEFQKRMRTHVSKTKESGQVIVSADKSPNLYMMDKDTYKSHLLNTITSTYKKTTLGKVVDINQSAYECSAALDLEKRMEKLQTPEAYITVKDHKANFHSNPSFRLINPSKTDVGRVSKQMLDGINKGVLSHVQANQWKNTKSVINWFSNIRGKRHCTFMQFDIDSFYPSISADLFDKALDFARQFVDISDLELSIIKQARRTLLFHDGEPWCKVGDNDEFDVPMGSYDGAEICELIGTYMLSLTSHLVNPTDIGLYRDDGLSVMRSCGRPEIERKKKELIKIFKDNGLHYHPSASVSGTVPGR